VSRRWAAVRRKGHGRELPKEFLVALPRMNTYIPYLIIFIIIFLYVHLDESFFNSFSSMRSACSFPFANDMKLILHAGTTSESMVVAMDLAMSPRVAERVMPRAPSYRKMRTQNTNKTSSKRKTRTVTQKRLLYDEITSVWRRVKMIIINPDHPGERRRQNDPILPYC
jgi:hypothetical protein